jgi:hypothetical protein
MMMMMMMMMMMARKNWARGKVALVLVRVTRGVCAKLVHDIIND